MNPLFERASGLTESIIAAAIEAHRDKGPGLIGNVTEGVVRLILPGSNL